MAGNRPSNTSQRVVLASHNAGKVRELANALATLGWNLAGMDEMHLAIPEETGTTFYENAALKAEAAALATELWSLADDSGLEVDALDGAPGVFTADFGGWQRLLDVMIDLPPEQRKARFVCVLALKRPCHDVIYFTGTCQGSISLQNLGDGGFGYDPVFIPEGDSRTFAEMTADEKATYSHRGRAVLALLEWATRCV